MSKLLSIVHFSAPFSIVNTRRNKAEVNGVVAMEVQNVQHA
jgi:hypothetical protein